MKIQMPATAEEAVEQLGAVGRLISAKKWERAAIITMLVGPPMGRTGRPTEKSSDLRTFPYTVTGLAAVGIHGLRSTNTIEHYRNRWCEQRPVPNLGDEVDLDGLGEWTGYTTIQKREERLAEAEKLKTKNSTSSVTEPAKPVQSQPVEMTRAGSRVEITDPDKKAEFARIDEMIDGQKTLVALAHIGQNLERIVKGWDFFYPTLSEADQKFARARLDEIVAYVERMRSAAEGDGLL